MFVNTITTLSIALFILLQAVPVSHGNWYFEKQLARVYTSSIYKLVRHQMKWTGYYKVEKDNENGDGHFLVSHTSRAQTHSWSQHKFKVTVKVAENHFTCECRSWEHTGMVLFT